MDLRFSLWNHSTGRSSCHDLVENLACQAEYLGHNVTYCLSCMPQADGVAMTTTDHFIEPPGVNVLLEAFDDRAVEELRRLVGLGLQFLIIMTETPGRHGFNDRHGQFIEQMRIRQRAFPVAAELAVGIGCLVTTAVPFAKKYNSKSGYLEIGYSALRERKIKAVAPRMFDYAFSGGSGDRRLAIIKRIEGDGLTVVTPERMYGSTMERNGIIARARGMLGLRSNPKWQIPSSSRFSTALHVGCYVAAERHDIDTPWSRVLDWPPTSNLDDYIEICHELARQPMGTYQRQMARFRDLMSPEKTMKPFLDMVFS